jgi:drug/metabolite transporter (DMT)-like permease
MNPSALFLALTSLILWSFLAFLGAKLVRLPPLLVVGIALCVGGMVGAVRLRSWRVPLVTFLVGAAGIFGYHFLYFSAFKFAPVVEASLINYLWPLLIVVLSPLFLVGYSLRWHHLIGATAGFLGASLIVMGERFQPNVAYLTGYILAAGAALTWAIYSLLTKRLPRFPTAAVGGFCLFGGLLSLAIYYLGSSSINRMILPTGMDWLYLILVGAGPMGLAFFTWDAALKRGDPRIIGSLAYLTPLTSTLILVLLGGRSLTWVSALAMLLIVAGAMIGSLDIIRLKSFSTQAR